MKEFKLSLLSFILGIKWTVFYILSYYLFIYFLFGSEVFGLWFSHMWPILITLPDVYLISAYLVEDYNKKLIIDNHRIIDTSTNKVYTADEIQKIVIHKSKGTYSGKLSFVYYKYAEIILKNRKKIIITSLIKSDIDDYLEENLKGIKFDRDFNIFL